MPLSDLQVRRAKSQSKPYKLTDGGGLFLHVFPNGSRYWRMQYRVDGKQKVMAFGVYPEISLADARQRRDTARRMLANAVDPGAVKKSQKLARKEALGNSFEAVAKEWLGKQSARWTEGHTKRVTASLENNVFPWIGGSPISEIKAPAILSVLRKIESRNAFYMAGRMKQVIGQVIRYAVATGRAEYDPTPSLNGALTPKETKHMASVTEPVKVGEILRAMDAFSGTFTVKSALQLAPYLFCRVGELRKMKWADIDFDEARWSIPAEVMKMREAHVVPLSKQALRIIKDIQPLSGHLEYVFPGGRDPKRPMSDAAINAALRRLGIDTQNELTGHGFRAMARTILHERLNYAPEIIEAQLAHKVPGPLGAAYARAKFMDQRVKMMQKWADYLDRLKNNEQTKSVPSRKRYR